MTAMANSDDVTDNATAINVGHNMSNELYLKNYNFLNPYINNTVDNDSNSWNFSGDPLNNSTLSCVLNLTNRNLAILASISVIFCLSVIGNCLVILTILQNRWMRTVTNYLLLNLAISDLLLTIICMPPTLTGFLFQCFFAGPFMCKLVNFMQPVSVSACSFTLVVIALERYKAICQPLHSRHWKTKSHSLAMIFLIWFMACVCSLPAAIMSELITRPSGMLNCLDSENTQAKLIYYSLLTIALFVIPSTLMTVLYSLVIRTLWKGMKLDAQSSRKEHEATNHSGRKMTLRVTQPDEQSNHTTDSGRLKNGCSRSSSSPVNLIRTVRQSVRKNAELPANNVKFKFSAATKATALARSPQSSSSDGAAKQPESESVLIKRQSHKKDSCIDPLSLRSTHAERTLLAKKRVIRMLAAIVVEFFLCWTPLYVFLLWFAANVAMDTLKDVNPSIRQNCHVTFLMLAYLSTCTNPITYCFLNVKFRHAVLITIGCRFLIKDLQKFNTMNHTNTSMYVQQPAQVTSSAAAIAAAQHRKRSADERSNGVLFEGGSDKAPNADKGGNDGRPLLSGSTTFLSTLSSTSQKSLNKEQDKSFLLPTSFDKCYDENSTNFDDNSSYCDDYEVGHSDANKNGTSRVETVRMERESSI